MLWVEGGGGEGHQIPGRILWISSDRDDRRIFLGLKFSIPGFVFGIGKFGKYLYGWLDLSRDFLGVFKTI